MKKNENKSSKIVSSLNKKKIETKKIELEAAEKVQSVDSSEEPIKKDVEESKGKLVKYNVSNTSRAEEMSDYNNKTVILFGKNDTF